MSTPALVAIGTAITLTLAVVVTFVVARRLRDARVAADVHRLFHGLELSTDVVSEADLEPLPAPVQRWLRHAGVVGRRPIRSTRMRQLGQMRTAPDQAWLPLRAEEYTRVPTDRAGVGLVWNARTTLNGVPMSAHDRVTDGRARMQLQLVHAITVSEAEGASVDESMLLRWLAQLPWFPTFAVDARVRWTAVDDHRARVTYQEGPAVVEAEFCIDDVGRVTAVHAERNRASGDGFVRVPWSLDLHGEVEHDEVRVPARSDAVWRPPAGAFCYLRITSIEELAFDTQERLESPGV